MSLFQEKGPYVPRTPPTPRKAPAIADPETAMKKLRELTRELREKIDHPPEVIQPLLKAALSLLSAMHAFRHIDIRGYGNRMQGLAHRLCSVILDNHNGVTSKALSNIGLLREEAQRRIAIVAEELDSEDEVDMMVDNDENIA